MKVVGKNTKFSDEKLKIIRIGKLDNSPGTDVSTDEFKQEVDNLFQGESEAVDKLIKFTS